MSRIYLSFLLPVLMAPALFSCAQDLETGHGPGPELRSLYTVQWTSDQTRVSVLSPRNNGGAEDGEEALCKNGVVNGAALVCPDRLVHLVSGAQKFYPRALKNPRSAALGEYDRIAYVLDQAGDLHVTDTGWSSSASDDLPLLLWTPGGDHLEVVAGNARRPLAEVELLGGLRRWAVDTSALYVLYENRLESGWSWGVERISLVDYRVDTVTPEQEVSSADEIPEELRITEEGRLKIYRDGAMIVELPL
jgi:hypothetical protein